MEAALLAAFVKYGIPMIIELLEKMGLFTAAEALAARTADDLIVDIKSLKTYQEYPVAGEKAGLP